MTRSPTQHRLIAIGLALGAVALAPAPVLAVIPGSTAAVNTDASKLAMKGYDAVAYFTDGQPTPGDARYAMIFQGARYQFASAEHLKAFEANPAAYTPQFGGFCAMGASFGEKVDADPTAWKVVDGKLYLNFSPKVGERWQKDIPGNIGRAEDYGPKIQNNVQ